MSNINRRLFLRGSASLATAAGVAAAPAFAAQLDRGENPALLRLDVEFQAAHADFLAADAARLEARRQFDALCPPVPESIIIKGADGWGLGEDEADCEGQTIWPDCKPAGRPRRLYRSDLVARFHGRDFRKRDGRHMKAVHEAAKAYEAAREGALQASGMRAVLDRRMDSIFRLGDLLGRMRSEPARTPAGLVIKASAMEAYAAIGAYEAVQASHGVTASLARDILAVFGRQA